MNRRKFLAGAAALAAVPVAGKAISIINCGPPLLVRPYTLIEDNDEWVYIVCGVVGPLKISDVNVRDIT